MNDTAVSRQTAFNVLLLLILGPYLLACVFVHPAADDFIYASNARLGFWSAWVREYAGWNGRYASNALVLSVPLAFGWLDGHRVAAAAMILSTVWAVYLFVRAISDGALSRQDALSCGLLFTAVYLNMTPSVGEEIYWFTSAATYHVPLVLALVHLALVIRFLRHERPSALDRAGLVLAFVLLAAIVGFNEVVMVMMLALYFLLSTWSAIERRRSRPLFVSVFLFTSLCALFVIFSPGNSTRQSMFPAHYQFMRSAGMSVLQMLRFTGDWASTGSLLLATAVLAPFGAKMWARETPNPKRTRQGLLLSAAGLLLVVPISVFPAYWETGILGQHRTVNTACFAFLVLWLVGFSLWTASGSRRAIALNTFAREWRVALALLLLVSLTLTRNSYALGLDFATGRLAAFDREMAARQRTLAACRDGVGSTPRPDCEVDAVTVKPATFFVLDVSSDPRDWVNVAYARYFGLAEVRRRPTQPVSNVNNVNNGEPDRVRR